MKMNERTYYVLRTEMDDCSLSDLYSWEDYQNSIFEAECLFNSHNIKLRF